jgi:hypothetical protein
MGRELRKGHLEMSPECLSWCPGPATQRVRVSSGVGVDRVPSPAWSEALGAQAVCTSAWALESSVGRVVLPPSLVGTRDYEVGNGSVL